MTARLVLLLLAVVIVGGEQGQQQQQQQQQQTCSLETSHWKQQQHDKDASSATGKSGSASYRDPNLVPLEYDVGEGPQTTLVYAEPEVSTFYVTNDDGVVENGSMPRSQVKPAFTGLQGKFVNLSRETVTLYWEAAEDGEWYLLSYLPPWTASGTSTFPTHRFVMAIYDEESDEEIVLERFIVQDYPHNIYVYDPYDVTAEEAPPLEEDFDEDELEACERWRKTLLFQQAYLAKTGRSYLANYLRPPPLHFMWPADFLGQQHWITTTETHFSEVPPADLLTPVERTQSGRLSPNHPQWLADYRQTATGHNDDELALLNMTLTVLSVAPRVLEIHNFLSAPEVAHVLELATRMQLKESTTGDHALSDEDVETDRLKTRTSRNTWVGREASPVIDAIYRRAADLQRVDEALLRHRQPEERPDVPFPYTLAEQLQLVHYAPTQQYTAHHDFGFAHLDQNPGMQPARFSTLLLYLNDEMEGGETAFPRWSNAETAEELAVKPELGKALLFYSQLPDGNLDDLSQHSAKPIIKGSKVRVSVSFRSTQLLDIPLTLGTPRIYSI
jgi:prolyl 4-hydroxylase